MDGVERERDEELPEVEREEAEVVRRVRCRIHPAVRGQPGHFPEASHRGEPHRRVGRQGRRERAVPGERPRDRAGTTPEEVEGDRQGKEGDRRLLEEEGGEETERRHRGRGGSSARGRQVASQEEEDEEREPHLREAGDPRDRLGVNRVEGEEQACGEGRDVGPRRAARRRGFPRRGRQ